MSSVKKCLLDTIQKYTMRSILSIVLHNGYILKVCNAEEFLILLEVMGQGSGTVLNCQLKGFPVYIRCGKQKVPTGTVLSGSDYINCYTIESINVRDCDEILTFTELMNITEAFKDGEETIFLDY